MEKNVTEMPNSELVEAIGQAQSLKAVYANEMRERWLILAKTFGDDEHIRLSATMDDLCHIFCVFAADLAYLHME